MKTPSPIPHSLLCAMVVFPVLSALPLSAGKPVKVFILAGQSNMEGAGKSLQKNFIRDVRKELGVAKLPFVIADSGLGGEQQSNDRRLMIRAAQAAPAKSREFKGNVVCVETAGFFRPPEESPSTQGYHWNGNASTKKVTVRRENGRLITFDLHHLHPDDREFVTSGGTGEE
jgi:hypothetical protein